MATLSPFCSHANDLTRNAPIGRTIVRGAIVSLCLMTMAMAGTRPALASAGCDAANAGNYNLTTGLGGLGIVNFNGNFEAGDILNFTTDANNLAVAIVNTQSGINVIAGVGALNTNFAITTTGNNAFTGTLTAIPLNATTLTVTCTAVSGGGGGGGGGGGTNSNKTNVVNSLVSALSGGVSLLNRSAGGLQADAFSLHGRFLRRRLDHLESELAGLRVYGNGSQCVRDSRHRRHSRQTVDCAASETRIAELENRIAWLRGELGMAAAYPAMPAQMPQGYAAGREHPLPAASGDAVHLPPLKGGEGSPAAGSYSLAALPYMTRSHMMPSGSFTSSATLDSFSPTGASGPQGDILTHTHGVKARLNDWLSGSIYTQFRHADAELQSPGDGVSANSYGLGASVQMDLSRSITLQAGALVEKAAGNFEILGDSGDFDATTVRLAARLDGDVPFGSWLLTPILGAEYYNTDRAGFSDTGGDYIPGATQQGARMNFGPELHRPILLHTPSGAVTLHPFMRIQGQWDFLSEDLLATSSQTLIDEGELSLRYGGGMRLVWSNDFALSLEAEQVARENGDGVSVSSAISIPFRSRDGEDVGALQLNAAGIPGGQSYAGFRLRMGLN